MRSAQPIPQDLDVDLGGLCAASAPYLARLPLTDQRIQAAPVARTFRFYQSTGLMDRPSRYDGRVARYGRRHLLQVLAVRVLQSQGNSLAQIQNELAGVNDAELVQHIDGAMGVVVPIAYRAVLAAPASASTAPTPLMAAELAPGLVVTIDSRFHHDPMRIIELLRRAIQGEKS